MDNIFVIILFLFCITCIVVDVFIVKKVHRHSLDVSGKVLAQLIILEGNLEDHAAGLEDHYKEFEEYKKRVDAVCAKAGFVGLK